MKFFKYIVLTTLSITLFNCGNSSTDKKNAFALEIQNAKKTYDATETIQVELKNKENKTIDSVSYFLNKDRVEITDGKLSLTGKKLGERSLMAKIYSDDEVYEASKRLTILPSAKPELYTYKILETYPHDIHAYTQGLEFKNDTLYESTGLYKQSSLRKTDYKTGDVLKKVALADTYFGEGLTILNNKIYQLTWKGGAGLIYNLKTLEQTGTFVYGQSREGWGLCNDGGNNIYKSDGTDRIWTLDPNTLTEKDYIEIFTNTSKISSVNELEWVDGKIYANVYQQGSIAIIDPKSGAVEGVINLTDLKDKVTQHKDLDVLNGIAYNGEPNILYITGKNWDKLFKVQIIKK